MSGSEPTIARATPPDAAPLVSVVLASRNGARFLPDALGSLAAQTWPHVELLAVDDGSTDGTGALLERFATGRPMTRVFRTEGIGPAAARALAIGEAHGAFFAVHDDDDVSHPERLERQVRHLLAHPGIGLLGSAADIIDERGERIGPHPVPFGSEAIRRTLRRAPAFVHGSVMIRREAYAAAGGYRAPFRAAEDYDLYLRLPAGMELENLPDSLYSWRRHPGNSFARARGDHLFFLATARALHAERLATGRDSVELLAGAADPEAFLAAYPFAGTLLFHLGEAYVREGRVAEARRFLRRSLARSGRRAAALAWWVLSFGVALTPRARAATPAGAGGPR